ncbi:MAG: insulinase family protein [Chrysiogenales bacterium]|nr:MAG: insulinase family protein [Chrysiogenales bacterium]
MKRGIVLPVLALALLAGEITGRGAIQDAGDYLKKNVVTATLGNVITVILLNRGYAPVLAFDVAFRVGSVDESYYTAGAAHLLEHMLFKGTDRLGTKDYKKERVLLGRIEAVGETIDRLRLTDPGNLMLPRLEEELAKLQKDHAVYVESSPYDAIYTGHGGVGLNASTSRDKTGYYVQLPASKLELWARIESERLINPVFREYYLERNNVVQERLMRYDSIGTGLLFETFLAQAFLAHPYRHPIIGWRSNIPFLSLGEVRGFFRERYVPSRMTITIVGRQDVQATMKVVRKYFEKIKSRPDPAPVSIAEPAQSGERRVIYNFESSPYLIMGWHKPAFASHDDFTCEVISEILTGGKSSRLYRSLVIEKRIASSVSAWNGAPGSRYDNLFTIFAAPIAPHTPEELEKALYGEIDRFFTDVSEEEISKVVNRIESEMVFGLGTNKGLAETLSYYQTVYGDWRYAATYLDMIRKVTKDDIRGMKDAYFTARNRTVAILHDSRPPAGGGER